MRLRKSLLYLSERARKGRSVPIGTERIDTEGKNVGTVMVKVCNTGPQSNRWRPKHHLIWQKANGRPVPKGFRVVFKDGNHANFDARNLELTTREAIGIQAFARFLSYPPPLQSAIRLTKKLEREIARKNAGKPAIPTARGGGYSGAKQKRWTPAMDARIRREFPRKQTAELARAMNVSRVALIGRAHRIGIYRSPEAMVRLAKKKAKVAIAQAFGAK